MKETVVVLPRRHAIHINRRIKEAKSKELSEAPSNHSRPHKRLPDDVHCIAG